MEREIDRLMRIEKDKDKGERSLCPFFSPENGVMSRCKEDNCQLWDEKAEDCSLGTKQEQIDQIEDAIQMIASVIDRSIKIDNRREK